MKRTLTNGTLWTLASIGLILLILLLFVLLVDVDAVWTQLRSLHWGISLAAVALLLLGLLLHAARWRYLLFNRVSLSSAFHAANICHALNMWLPFRPGEPARIAILGEEEKVGTAEVAGTVLVDRWLDNVMRLLFLVLAVGIGLGLRFSAWTISGAGLLLAGVLLAMLAAVRYQEVILKKGPPLLAWLPWVSVADIRRILAGVVQGLTAVASARRLLPLFGWSLAIWVALAGFHYLMLMALGVDLPIPAMWTLAVGAVVLSPPTAATEPGLYHASVVGPLALVGFDPALLTAYAVAMHGIQMILITTLGLWGFSASGDDIRKLVRDIRTFVRRARSTDSADMPVADGLVGATQASWPKDSC